MYKGMVLIVFQSLIGRFVTLSESLVYYIGDFSTLAEITQCSMRLTHKGLQSLESAKTTYCDNLQKNRVFYPLKIALVIPKKFPNHKLPLQQNL